MSTPKAPKIPNQKPVEDILQVNETASDAVKMEKKKLLQTSGRNSTFISGLQNALKERLGV